MISEAGHLIQAFTAQPLAIDEGWLLRLAAGAIAPRELSPHVTEIAAAGDFQAAEAAMRPPVRSSGGTAVISVMGPLQKRADIFTLMFGGTSYDGLTSQLTAALNDDAIKSIVFNVDSPGGAAEGAAEAAKVIFEARGRKPITAIANTMMASAAYFLGSQADEVAVTTSGWAGSIGVVMLHMDWSAAFEQAGVKPTLIRSGKYKVDANPYEPLSEGALAHLQALSDEWYGQFVSAVARGRGVSESDVRGGFGQGRMEVAQAAVRAGIADRVATLDEVLARHGGNASSPRARAEDSREQLARVNALAFAVR